MTKIDSKFALKLSAILTLAALALPLAAQQEVSPEHFDHKPSAARSHKSALPAHKTTTAGSKKSAGRQGTTAAKAKRKPQAPSVLTADAATSPKYR